MCVLVRKFHTTRGGASGAEELLTSGDADMPSVGACGSMVSACVRAIIRPVVLLAAPVLFFVEEKKESLSPLDDKVGTNLEECKGAGASGKELGMLFVRARPSSLVRARVAVSNK